MEQTIFEVNFSMQGSVYDDSDTRLKLRSNIVGDEGALIYLLWHAMNKAPQLERLLRRLFRIIDEKKEQERQSTPAAPTNANESVENLKKFAEEISVLAKKYNMKEVVYVTRCEHHFTPGWALHRTDRSFILKEIFDSMLSILQKHLHADTLAEHSKMNDSPDWEEHKIFNTKHN